MLPPSLCAIYSRASLVLSGPATSEQRRKGEEGRDREICTNRTVSSEAKTRAGTVVANRNRE